MEFDYRLDESILDLRGDWEVAQRMRELNPDDPDMPPLGERPSDTAFWLEEVNQYLCAIQNRTFEYIDQHYDEMMTAILASAQSYPPQCTLGQIKNYMPEGLWNEWRALGIRPEHNVYDFEVEGPEQLDASAYDPEFRQWVALT